MDKQSKKTSPLSLKKNMLWNSGGSLVYLLGQWLMSVLIVRLSSGYDAAGLLTLAMSVYGIFSPIAQYRMYTYQVSDVKKENTAGEYMAFRLLTCSIALLSCAIYSLFTCPLEAVLPILLYGIFKTSSSIIDVLHATDQRYRRMDFIGMSLGLQGVFSFIVFVVVFAASRDLCLTFIGMTICCALVGVIYDLPHTLRFGKIHVRITRQKAWKLLVMCAPMVIGSILMATAPSLPRQYLFAKFGDAMLGIYGSISAPVAIIQMGAAYIYNPLIGYFSDYYAARNMRDFYKLLARASLAILGVGILCGIALMVAGKPLLNLLFSNNIDEYIYILPLIIVSAILVAYMGFLNDLLITFRDLKGTLIGGAVAFVISAIATIPCVNLFVMNGISISLILSALASSVVMLCLVRMRTKRA